MAQVGYPNSIIRRMLSGHRHLNLGSSGGGGGCGGRNSGGGYSSGGGNKFMDSIFCYFSNAENLIL